MSLISVVGLVDKVSRARVWRWVAPLGNVVGVVCGLVGVIADRLSISVRIGIAIVGLLLWGCASLGSYLVSRAQREDLDEIAELRARIASSGGADRVLPDQAMRAIAPLLFKPRVSWRLTLFVLEEINGEWFLRPRIRCAASEMYEGFGRERIPLAASVLRELKLLDLPANNELGEAPDRDTAFDQWRDWQSKFISDSRVVDSLRMPTRKYAWCATRQPGVQGRTIALVAETIQPSGVNPDVLSSSLFPPLMEMLARLVDLPEALEASV